MKISTTTWDVAERLGSEEAALLAIAEAGFDACDFSLWYAPLHGGLWDLSDAEFDRIFIRLRNVAKEAGLLIGQSHAIFPVTRGDGDDAFRLACIRRGMRATALLGGPMIVVHPAKHLDELPDEGYRQATAYNAEMYAALLPAAEEAGVKIALENMFHTNRQTGRIVPSYFSSAQHILHILDLLDSKWLCVCLDIGHAILTGESPAEMIRAFGPHLQCLHVQDNDGLVDQHLLPGLGRVDWPSVCGALRDIQYSGLFNLEAGGFIPSFVPGTERAALSLMAQTARHWADTI